MTYLHILQTRDSVYKRLPLHVDLMTPDFDIASALGKDILGRFPLHYACHHAADPAVVEASLVVSAYPLAISHTARRQRMASNSCGVPL
jgi:hypothetical protein